MRDDYQIQTILVAICLVLLRAHMSILFIMNMRIMEFIDWSYIGFFGHVRC